MTLIFERYLPKRFVPYWNRFVVTDDNIWKFMGNVPQRFVPYWKQTTTEGDEEINVPSTTKKSNKRTNREYDETSPPLKTKK